jgi:hypothetical protein
LNISFIKVVELNRGLACRIDQIRRGDPEVKATDENLQLHGKSRFKRLELVLGGSSIESQANSARRPAVSEFAHKLLHWHGFGESIWKIAWIDQWKQFDSAMVLPGRKKQRIPFLHIVKSDAPINFRI